MKEDNVLTGAGLIIQESTESNSNVGERSSCCGYRRPCEHSQDVFRQKAKQALTSGLFTAKVTTVQMLAS